MFYLFYGLIKNEKENFKIYHQSQWNFDHSTSILYFLQSINLSGVKICRFLFTSWHLPKDTFFFNLIYLIFLSKPNVNKKFAVTILKKRVFAYCCTLEFYNKNKCLKELIQTYFLMIFHSRFMVINCNFEFYKTCFQCEVKLLKINE